VRIQASALSGDADNIPFQIPVTAAIKTDPSMKIFVVIVTYNGAPWIRGALDSLRRSELPCTAVVIDNASSDRTVEIVKTEFPEAIVIVQTANTGFGCGNNVGISLAMAEGADYVFLLNQDAFVTPRALGQLATFLEAHSEYAVATPLHCSPDLNSLDPNTQQSYLQRYAPNYISDACLGLTKSFYDIRGINAAAWMVRTSAFAIVGGFDPLFFMYGEDDDLITRFECFGQRFALLPESLIVHLRARSPRPKASFARRLWQQSERARSELLMDMKSSEGRIAGKLLRLFADGIVHPFARLLVDHNWRNACAYLIATARVLVHSGKILNNAKLCRTIGAHFLDHKPVAKT
jgi:GT2 family glycosyltransferase